MNEFYERFIPRSRDYVFVRPEREGQVRSLLGGTGRPRVIVSEFLPEGKAYLYTPPDDLP